MPALSLKLEIICSFQHPLILQLIDDVQFVQVQNVGQLKYVTEDDLNNIGLSKESR